MTVVSYKDLIVWQKSIQLVEEVYHLTARFPSDERFGLASQMRRASISIPSNIAEGYGRRSQKECTQFYAISYGSALELETQIIIARKLTFIEHGVQNVDTLLLEVSKMLYVMIYKRKGRG